MSVKKDTSGRRWVHVDVEVPGTPEEVWEAIATGAGISSWFVPTEVEEREGGAIVAHFGPGMDAKATVTTWDPPNRMAALGEGMTPDSPPVASEWIVKAQSGGTCTVRVVNSLFASNDDWDDQLTGVESGWPRFFRILKLYLTHFRGQACSPFQTICFASGSTEDAWRKLTDPLGLADAKAGQRHDSPAGTPRLAGRVESVGSGEKPHEVLLRVDDPAPGLVSFGAFDMGGHIHVLVGVLLYGPRAAETATREEPVWRSWLHDHFDATPGG